jgi:hypothetical protein
MTRPNDLLRTKSCCTTDFAVAIKLTCLCIFGHSCAESMCRRRV